MYGANHIKKGILALKMPVPLIRDIRVLPIICMLTRIMRV
jgi:hypothetical protein